MVHYKVNLSTPGSCLGTWHTAGEKTYTRQHEDEGDKLQVHCL